MKWSDVVITDENDKDHIGFDAKLFVIAKCSRNTTNTRTDGTIEVNPGFNPFIDDREVKKVLFTRLQNEAKRLRFFTEVNSQRGMIPVARVTKNVFNINQAKLKIEFIYKQDFRSTTKTFLKNPVVSVRVEFAGNSHNPATDITKEAVQGIVDLGAVPPGKYTLTPNYVTDTKILEPCKFDFEPKPQIINLEPSEIQIATFEVEPLYQKVQLLAHCLLAVPDWKFVLTDEDKKKVDVTTEPSGKQIFAFKTANVQDGFYVKADLSPFISATKAKIDSLPDGSGTLTLLPQKIPGQFWALTDLTLNESVIEKKASTTLGKNIFIITLKAGEDPNDFKLNDADSAKATIIPIPSGFKLTLLAKTRYATLAEVQNQIDQNADKMEVIRQSPGDANVYEIQFKPRFKDVTYTIKDLEGGWKGKYHGLPEDKADIDARVRLVEATLNYAHTVAENDVTILKVFMLPECFFQGMYGSYLVGDPDLKDESDQLFFKLLNLVGDVKWRDWVFAFGTVNFTFGEEVGIREMINYAPVLRGGLGSADKAVGSGGQSDKQLRLIQKLVNSEELIGADTLINNPGEKRKPSVNEDVQFQANQSEEEVGKILRKLLDKDDNFKNLNDPPSVNYRFWGMQHKIKGELWAEMKSELENNVKTLGLTRVVRSIRICKIEGTPDNLSEWGYYSGYQNSKDANREPSTSFGVTSEGLIIRFIKEGWGKYNLARNLKLPLENEVPKQEVSRVILDDIRKHQDELFRQFGITLPSHKNEMKTEIKKLDNETKLIEFFKLNKDTLIPENFGASIYPMWKKILEIYCKEQKIKDAPLNPTISKLDYRDFCFAAERKAGTLLTWEKAKDLDDCKKLIFGLEICADHANGRLRSLVQEQIVEFQESFLEYLKEIPDTDTAYTEEQRKIENARIAKENEEIKKRNLDLQSKKVRMEQAKKEVQDRNDAKPKVTIDIQLVPSAGMRLAGTNIVARKGGYGFNCDGWNQGKEDVGDNVLKDAWFEGPEPSEGNPFGNPATPHTAIAKGGGGEVIKDDEKDKFALKLREKLAGKIDPPPVDGILSKKGLGELHVYKPLDLPKD